MSEPLFDTHIVVDWSARSSPSPMRPSADAIWWAVVRGGQTKPPVYQRTRGEAVKRLADFLAAEVAAGRRVLIGFDFPFGYPEGVAARITGRAEAFALWDWIAMRVHDGPDNANRRFEVAAEINRFYDGVGPAWGRPAAWDVPDVPVAMKERWGADHPPERRRADGRSTTAKTVWQLAYAGSVGSQILLGLPALKTLREDPRLRGYVAVWPFDSGFEVPEAAVVLAEVYPSVLQPQVHARRRADEVLDAAQVRVLAAGFAALDASGGLGPLFSAPEGLTAADHAVVCAEEAWILGLDQAAALAAALPQPTLTGAGVSA